MSEPVSPKEPVADQPNQDDAQVSVPTEPNAHSGPPEATASDPNDTVGTGSALALGCIAATLLLILVGLVLIAAIAIFG